MGVGEGVRVSGVAVGVNVYRSETASEAEEGMLLMEAGGQSEYLAPRLHTQLGAHPPRCCICATYDAIWVEAMLFAPGPPVIQGESKPSKALATGTTKPL